MRLFCDELIQTFAADSIINIKSSFAQFIKEQKTFVLEESFSWMDARSHV